MTIETILRGKAWGCGDFIDASKILPEQYWRGGTKVGSLDAGELGKHAMEGVDPSFAEEALAGEYAFIVAGRNFGGGGKSIEHPIFAIKGTGVKGVLAESCSRYFFRNAINNGLLIMICEGITGKVKTGDELEVNALKGEILNITNGCRLASPPIPDISWEILNIGGYIAYARKRMTMK